MKIGYARVSTLEQNLDFQVDVLLQAGCQKIITDEISGSTLLKSSFKTSQVLQTEKSRSIHS